MEKENILNGQDKKHKKEIERNIIKGGFGEIGS